MAGISARVVRFQIDLNTGVFCPLSVVEAVPPATLHDDVVPAAVLEGLTVLTFEYRRYNTHRRMFLTRPITG